METTMLMSHESLLGLKWMEGSYENRPIIFARYLAKDHHYLIEIMYDCFNNLWYTYIDCQLCEESFKSSDKAMDYAEEQLIKVLTSFDE
jgi:hypothetical protein